MKTEQLTAYKGDPKFKADFVAEVQRHKDADQIVQGTYGEGSGRNWRGCAVGCAIHSLNKLHGTRHRTNNHRVYELELGIPRPLAYLEDRIFESLPVEKAQQWPLRFVKSIQPGADLSLVTPRFIYWLLGPRNTVYRNARSDGRAAIKQVRSLYERVLDGGVVTDQEWDNAWSAARSAAWSAAESAARSAAWSAAWSARSAAWSAAESAAWSARSAGYERMADKLIELLKAAPLLR